MRLRELWLRWRRVHWQFEADRAGRRLEEARRRYHICTMQLRVMRGASVIYLRRR